MSAVTTLQKPRCPPDTKYWHHYHQWYPYRDILASCGHFSFYSVPGMLLNKCRIKLTSNQLQRLQHADSLHAATIQATLFHQLLITMSPLSDYL